MSAAPPEGRPVEGDDAEPVTIKQLTDYWFAHYVSESGHCSLCGNHGIIDTSDSPNGYTPAGLSVGRRNFCICPNGLQLRARAALSARPTQGTDPR